MILKGIITEADWESIRYKIQYNFATDAYYTESKEQQILQSRVEILNGVANYIGSLYSKEYVQKNILKLTDDEIAEIEASNEANQPEVPPAEEQPPQPEQTEQG